MAFAASVTADDIPCNSIHSSSSNVLRQCQIKHDHLGTLIYTTLLRAKSLLMNKTVGITKFKANVSLVPKKSQKPTIPIITSTMSMLNVHRRVE